MIMKNFKSDHPLVQWRIQGEGPGSTSKKKKFDKIRQKIITQHQSSIFTHMYFRIL